MAGLEKIKQEIDFSASQKAESIINSAKAQSELLIAEATENGEKLSAEINSLADEKIALIKSATESAVVLDRKNKILFSKTELINTAFEKAREYFNSLEKEDYLEIAEKLIVSNAMFGEGMIFANEKCFSFISEDFIKKVCDLLPKGKRVKLFEKPDLSLSDGFIIKYDNIEINCEFDTVIDFATERLSDSVNSCLFG